MMDKIKDFIDTCPYLKDKKINVDYLDDENFSYSIDKSPTNPIYKKYTDGHAIKQILFNFNVVMPITSIALENLMNSSFFDDFAKWIDTQNKKRNLPEIDGVQSIECTTNDYILVKSEATTAIYTIQMNCKYYE